MPSVQNRCVSARCVRLCVYNKIFSNGFMLCKRWNTPTPVLITGGNSQRKNSLLITFAGNLLDIFCNCCPFYGYGQNGRQCVCVLLAHCCKQWRSVFLQTFTYYKMILFLMAIADLIRLHTRIAHYTRRCTLHVALMHCNARTLKHSPMHSGRIEKGKRWREWEERRAKWVLFTNSMDAFVVHLLPIDI